MAERLPLALRSRNPDVLTCIASLSNDEVFTPPDLAGRMLDMVEEAWAETNGGISIWTDPTVRFLDPFAKSGIFLREIVKRLNAGLVPQFPDLQERVDHILTHQVFGIAITQLTGLLARRSVYCSKHANGEHSISTKFDSADGNIWFQPIAHTWDGATEWVHTANEQGKPVQLPANGKCKYCGANQKDYDRDTGLETHAYALLHNDNPKKFVQRVFGGDMQFDIVVGNPPYQLGSTGGDSVGGFAMPIYQKFIQAAKQLDPRYIAMVTPARWYAGGRGLDEFRTEMLRDRRIRALVDFPNAQDCFPGIEIKGGVSYFLWDRDHPGDCKVTTMTSGAQAGPAMSRKLDEYDVLVRRNEAIPILEKVMVVSKKHGFDFLNARVSAIQPFSIRTNFKGAPTKKGIKEPVLLYGNKSQTWIARKDVPRNDEWIDQWKVLLGSAYGAGESTPHQIYNYPVVAGPGTACTETYLVIDRFEREDEARRFALYLRSRFVRFLVSLRKNTQHLYSERFAFVPNLDMSQEWTDQELYKLFGISTAEAEFIAEMIRPMVGDDDEAN